MVNSVHDHILSLIHGKGRIDISVGTFPTPLSQFIISNEGGFKDEEGGVETEMELATKGGNIRGIQLRGDGGGLNVEDEGGGGVGNVKTTQRVAATHRGVEGFNTSRHKMGGEVCQY